MANNTARETLHETALQAPSLSGVYLWKNSEGDVIYVGKAKNLKKRLCSYFLTNRDIKTRILVAHAAHIEYITCANEYEAFLLENNLIKKYNPRYNINLKDGKSYPVLRVTNEDFPRMFKTRRILQDGSTYFGPYPDAGALDTFIDTLSRIYPLRHCRTLKKRDAPCVYYHMGWCKAPCCEKISKEAYSEYIGEISALLEGKDGKTSEATVEKITAEMKRAAANLNFEKAARLRDGLNALAILQNQNVVEGFGAEDCDYIAHWREGELVSFTVLKLRGGKLVGRDNYRTRSLAEDEELVPEFFNAYYTNKNDVPPRVYVAPLLLGERVDADLKSADRADADSKNNARAKKLIINNSSDGGLENGDARANNADLKNIDRAVKKLTINNLAATKQNNADSGVEKLIINNRAGVNSENIDRAEDSSPNESIALLSASDLTRWFSETLDAATNVIEVADNIENAARHIAALNMARQNAHEDIARRLRERGDIPALEELKTLLQLDTLPVRIEGFDIAHIGGKFPVASLISFYNGNPDKKNYRYFRLKTTDGIIDDFASMREAAARRYTRLLNEQADLPDLILIDGGIGQVNAVQGVLDSLGLDIAIAGLAKRDEEIYRPGKSEPIVLPKRSDALRLLQRVRDETHRFATSKNQKLRTKENTVSVFMQIPNVGEKRARALIKAFGTLENLANADVAAVADVAGVGEREAKTMLAAAKEINKAHEAKKAEQMRSLKAVGTTAQNAARANYIDSLADAALAVAEKSVGYGK